MSIQLTQPEEMLRGEIEKRMDKARESFKESRLGDDVTELIFEAGKIAHELHVSLKNRGIEPKHHAYMISNREMPPDNPEFYMHFHPIEDLLKFLDNPNANDDPVDQTMGAHFTFRVFSNRWGHEDTYKLQRTQDGWVIMHIAIGGPCDPGGRPFLFDNLRQDSIHFPAGLDDRMEWLWHQAGTKGLTHEQVQEGLQQLGDWVSTTERSIPTHGVWEGY